MKLSRLELTDGHEMDADAVAGPAEHWRSRWSACWRPRAGRPAMKPLLIDQATGGVAPTAGGATMLSSTRSPWQGVYLEEHAGGAVEPVMVEPRKHLLIVQAEQATAFEYQADGLTQWIRMPPGHVSAFPAFKPFAVQNRDTRQYLTVAIEPRLLLRAGPEFQVLCTNSVHEPTSASLAAAAGELFQRTDLSLWCFGSNSPVAPTSRRYAE